MDRKKTVKKRGASPSYYVNKCKEGTKKNEMEICN